VSDVRNQHVVPVRGGDGFAFAATRPRSGASNRFAYAFMALLIAGTAHAAGDDALASAHTTMSAQLAPGQAAALAASYPDYRIVARCAGNFSGASAQEAIVGIWTGSLHRIGLVAQAGKWQVHDIDRELLKDEPVSHSFPLAWDHKLDASGFHGLMKCNVVLRSEPAMSSGGKPLGPPPLFSLRAGQKSNACFASSAEYNNWDCLAYDPAQQRFRLWYQQVFAD
jgi:hypothetical protein